jgi:hypothetical protein
MRGGSWRSFKQVCGRSTAAPFSGPVETGRLPSRWPGPAPSGPAAPARWRSPRAAGNRRSWRGPASPAFPGGGNEAAHGDRAAGHGRQGQSAARGPDLLRLASSNQGRHAGGEAIPGGAGFRVGSRAVSERVACPSGYRRPGWPAPAATTRLRPTFLALYRAASARSSTS